MRYLDNYHMDQETNTGRVEDLKEEIWQLTLIGYWGILITSLLMRHPDETNTLFGLFIK